jgi:hypothetical protein
MHSDLIAKMPDAQRKLFQEWAGQDEGMGYHFKALEQRTGLSRAEIRELVHGLRDAGYLEFMRGCFTEDGEPYGSAYVLTAAGRAALKALEARDG